MPFTDLWTRQAPTLSFEFYPGHNEKSTIKLHETIKTLLSLCPDFMSVTFGAGGTSRGGSLELLKQIRFMTTVQLVGYIAAYGLSQEELGRIALTYQQIGVDALFAIRGDIPQENPIPPHPQGCSYAADLVKVIKNRSPLPIGVAAYPDGHVEATDRMQDWERLVDKIRSGADYIITQYFYDNAAFYALRDFLRSQGIKIPILAGIMPIYSSKLTFSLAEKCGAHLPKALKMRIQSIAPDDKEAIHNLGCELALDQCRDLIAKGVDGLHFYTMDRSPSVMAIVTGLRQEGLL